MSPYLLKLFLRMLQLSFAVYIQKCFVCDLNFQFWVNSSLK